MAFITGTPTISELDLYQSTTQAPSGLQLGDFFQGPNGKFFRLVQAGGSDLVVGNVIQSPAIDTQFDDLAVAANVAAGQDTIVVTNGTTAVAAGDLIGGSVEFSVTPHLGGEYTIVGHSTAANGAALTLNLDRPLRVAITSAASKATVKKSPYRGVIQAPTTLTGLTVGVAIWNITASSYGFIQVGGIAAVLSDNSTFAVGSALANSAATAGCAGVFVAGTARSLIGHAYRAAASGKTIPVLLVNM